MCQISGQVHRLRMHGRNDPETMRLPLPTDTTVSCMASLLSLLSLLHIGVSNEEGFSGIGSGLHGHNSGASSGICSCSVVLSIDILYIFFTIKPY